MKARSAAGARHWRFTASPARPSATTIPVISSVANIEHRALSAIPQVAASFIPQIPRPQLWTEDTCASVVDLPRQLRQGAASHFLSYLYLFCLLFFFLRPVAFNEKFMISTIEPPQIAELFLCSSQNAADANYALPTRATSGRISAANPGTVMWGKLVQGNFGISLNWPPSNHVSHLWLADGSRPSQIILHTPGICFDRPRRPSYLVGALFVRHLRHP